MRRHQYVFVVLLLLAGCASLGLPEPQSITERIAYANGQVTALTHSATTSLRAGRISVADARYVSEVSKETAALLDAAEIAATGGDISTAEGRLQLASTMLATLESYLTAREGS